MLKFLDIVYWEVTRIGGWLLTFRPLTLNLGWSLAGLWYGSFCYPPLAILTMFTCPFDTLKAVLALLSLLVLDALCVCTSLLDFPVS